MRIASRFPTIKEYQLFITELQIVLNYKIIVLSGVQLDYLFLQNPAFSLVENSLGVRTNFGVNYNISKKIFLNTRLTNSLTK